MNKTNNNFYPAHIAIIMDGNGRWAKKKSLPRIAGHQKGAKRAREIIEASIKLNLEYLTLFAFSSENWSRPKNEVNDLMVLLNDYLNKETEQYLKRNVKLRVIGNRNRLQSSIVKRIQQIENITINNNGLQLTIALDYSGREDILFAIKEIYKSYVNKKINFDEINIPNLSNYLMTSELPDPDLIIRTSGEVRLSNFFLWQSAYSEFEFVKCCWPDFTKRKFMLCLEKFKNRERRYGNIHE